MSRRLRGGGTAGLADGAAAEGLDDALAAATEPVGAGVAGRTLVGAGARRGVVDVDAGDNHVATVGRARIAVLPQRGGSGEDAKRNAERVLRSLIKMGLPTDRVIMVSETSDLVSQGEVQIYAR